MDQIIGIHGGDEGFHRFTHQIVFPVAIQLFFLAEKPAKQVPIAMAKCCPHCGKHFAEMPAREDAESVTSRGSTLTVVGTPVVSSLHLQDIPGD